MAMDLKTLNQLLGNINSQTLDVNNQPIKESTDTEEYMNGVPMKLVNAVVKQESGGNPNAISSAGAVGMMQLMDSTARDLGLRVDKQVDERKDPKKNMDAGTRYLKQMYDKYNDWELALAAYNAGPGTVDKWIKSGKNPDLLPKETKDYVNILKPYAPSSFLKNLFEKAGIPLQQNVPETLVGAAIPGEKSVTDLDYVEKGALNSLFTDMKNSFYQGMDETQKSTSFGKLDDYQEVIDSYPDKKSQLDYLRTSGRLSESDYMAQLDNLQKEVESASSKVREYSQDIQDQETEVSKEPVSKRYQVQSKLIQAQGSESGFWDNFYYTIPETAGSSASLMGAQLAATFGGDIAKKLIVAGLGAIAPEPVATKLAAATALTSAIGLLAYSRHQESQAEIGDAIKTAQTDLLEQWQANHPNQSPSEEDLRQIRIQARAGKNDLYWQNMALAIPDIAEAVLLPGSSLGPLFSEAAGLEKGLESFKNLNKATRMAGYGAGAYTDWAKEKFEEGYQYAASQRQHNEALNLDLYDNKGLIKNIMTDSFDTLNSLDYSPVGIVRNPDGRYSHDPNFQFAEQSGGMLGLFSGGISIPLKAAKDLYLYNKINKELAQDPFNSTEDSVFKLKSSIIFNSFENDTVHHLVEGLKSLNKQKDVNGNQLLSDKDLQKELGNIAIAYKKYETVSNYINSFGNIFSSKELKEKKKLIKEDLFKTILHLTKYNSDLDVLQAKKSATSFGISLKGRLADIENQIALREDYIAQAENALDATQSSEGDQAYAKLYDYKDKIRIFKAQIDILKKEQADIKAGFSQDELDNFEKAKSQRKLSADYNPLVDDISIEQALLNSEIAKAEVERDRYAERYDQLKNLKSVDSAVNYIDSRIAASKEKLDILEKQQNSKTDKTEKPGETEGGPAETTGGGTEDFEGGPTATTPEALATVQKVGTLEEYQILPDLEGKTDGKVNPETGFIEYQVLKPDGTVDVVSQEGAWYKTNETFRQDSKHLITGVDHFLNPFQYNLSKEKVALARVAKTLGMTSEEVLKQYPEAFPAHAAGALYAKILSKKNFKDYIDITVTRKFSDKNINFNPVVFESDSGLVGLRTTGLSMIMRLTDPDDANNVQSLFEIYPPDFYAIRQADGSLKPLDFTDASQMNLGLFNSMFGQYDRTKPFSQGEFDTFVNNWKSVKDFKVALETGLKGVDLTEPAVIKDGYTLKLSAQSLDFIPSDKPYIKMTSSDILKEAPIYYADLNPSNSRWLTKNSVSPGYELPVGTTGYWAVATFENGLMRWVKLVPAKFKNAAERNTVVTSEIKRVVDELHELDVNLASSADQAKQIVQSLNFFIAAYQGNKITAFPLQAEGKYILDFLVENEKSSKKSHARFGKFKKGSTSEIDYNYKYILKKINEAATAADAKLFDEDNFRANPKRDMSEETYKGNLRDFFDIEVTADIVKGFSVKIILDNNKKVVSDKAPASNPTPSNPSTPGKSFTPKYSQKYIQDKIGEILKNKDFIVLSADGENYVNTKTGKIYKRVTSYIKEDKSTGPLIKASQIIGTKVDQVVRDFFSNNLKDLSKYDVSNTEQLKKFVEQLTKFKYLLDSRGEKVIANDIVLYDDNLGIAGTIDLLSYNSSGVVRIYDMKTMRGNNFTQTYKGDTTNKYESTKFGKSKKEVHSEQLSLYRILMNNTNNLLADDIVIIPIEVSYNEEDTSTNVLNLLPLVKLPVKESIKDAKLVTKPTVQPAPTSPVSDIEAKKADIERRRQEELNFLLEEYKGNYDDAYSDDVKDTNAKYDAELAALKEEKPATEYQPGDNSPTVNNVEGLTEAEKREQSQDNDAANNAFKVVDKSDITTPVTLEEQLYYITQHLPAGITREDIDTLHINVANNQIAVGVVINNAIYLRDVADVSDLLHESFHVVFRNSISDERSRTYLNKVKSVLNYSSEKLAAEKDKLRATGLYEGFTESQLEDQVYEEYMADNFVAWKKGQEVKSWLAKLFEKIMNFIRFYLTDDVRGLYAAIDRGYFKNSSIIKTRYNAAGATNTAYKLLYGATQSQSANTLKQIMGKILTDGMTVSQAFNFFIEYYNPDSEENARIINSSISPAEVADEFRRYQSIFTSKANQAILSEAVSKELNKLNIDKAVVSDILSDVDPNFDDQDQPERQWDLSDAYVDPYSRLGRRIKAIIGNTTYTATFYGKPYQKPLDVRVFYSRLLPVLSVTNTPGNMIMPKLQALSDFDIQIKAFYEKLKYEMDYNEETQEVSSKGRQLYNSLVKAFEVEQLIYDEVVHNITDKEAPINKVYSLNKIDLGDARLAEWANYWKVNIIGPTGLLKDKKSKEYTAVFKGIQEFLSKVGDKEGITKATVTALKKNSLDRLGIRLEIPFLLYSFGTTKESENLQQLFDGAPKLTADHLTVLLRALDKKSDPYREDSATNIGMYKSLKDIATGNAYFDTSFILKTFPDSEGKVRYAYVASNRILSESRRLKGIATKEGIKNEISKNNGYLKLNPVFTSEEEAKIILSNLNISLTANFRIAVDEEDPLSKTVKEVSKAGVTGKSLDADTMDAMTHMLFLATKQTKATKIKYAKYWLSQISDKSTQYAVELPVSRMWDNGTITDFAAEKLFNLVKQEYLRNKGQYWDYIKKDKFLLFPFLSSSLMELDETAFDAQKEDILTSIKDNFDALIVSYKQDLISKELLVKGKFTFLDNKAIEAEYGNTDNYLGNFFLNQFIYTTGALQLFVGDIGWTKGWEDFVKRMAGGIASGNTLGKEDFILVHTTDIEDNLDKNTLETVEKPEEGKTAAVTKTDAQNWSTMYTKKYILDSLGELSPTVESALEKIMAGEDSKLTKEERKEFDGISAKLVGFGPDANGNEQYNKQSTFFLSKGLTSMKDKEGNWVAQPHREALHNLREYLEGVSKNSQPVLASPKSANKKYKAPKPADLAGFIKGTPKIDESAVTRLNGQYVRKQQENDTKDNDSIIFVRQLIDLLGSEISDPEMLSTLESFREDLAKVRNEAFNFAKNLVVQEVAGKYERANITDWIENLRNTIEMSTPDSQMLELLDQADVDFNLPHLEKKLKQLFLNTFKAGFQKRVTGRKATLVSPFGFNVIVDKSTGRVVPTADIVKSKNVEKWKDTSKYEIRELNIHKLSKDGKVIEDAEFLMTRKTAELMGINISDPSQDDYLKIFANRIPLQGKNMSAVGKIVDFLPDYYGDVIVGPKELVYLGGMDFDVDSLFVFLQNFFYNENGELVKYGEEKSDEERFYGFKQYLYKNNSYIARDIKKRLYNNPDYKVLKLDPTLGEDLGDFSDAALIASVMGGEVKDSAVKKITDQAISETLEKFGYPSTLEEFIVSKTESEGVIQNRIHKAIYTLLKSPELAEAYKTPTNHDKTDASIKYLEKIGALSPTRKANIIPNTPVSVVAAYNNSTKGKNLTGIAVNANTAGAALAEYKFSLNGPFAFGKNSYADFFTDNKALERDKNDANSTAVTNAVDNANKPVSEDLNASKYTTPHRAILINLGVANPENPNKVDLEFIDSFFNLPLIKSYVNALEMQDRNISPVFGRSQRIINQTIGRVDGLIARVQSFAKSNPDNEAIQNDLQDLEDLIQLGTFTKQDLETIHGYDKVLLEKSGVNDLTYDQLKEVAKLNIIQYKALNSYLALEEISKYVQALSTIMSLNRKLPTELGQLDMYQNAADMLIDKNKTVFSLGGLNRFFSNPNVNNNLTNINDIKEISELYFLENTILFKTLKEQLEKYFVRDADVATRDFLSFVTFKLLKGSDNTKYDSYYEYIVPTMGKTLLERFNELNVVDEEGNPVYPEFVNNPFIKALEPHPASESAKNVIDILAMDSRTKFSGETIDMYIDSITALRRSGNPKISEFSVDLVKYLIAKDSFQFKNYSFIKFMPANTFAKMMQVMKELNTSLAYNDSNEFADTVKKSFSTTPQGLLDEFYKIYGTQFNNTRALRNFNFFSRDLTTGESRNDGEVEISEVPGIKDGVYKIVDFAKTKTGVVLKQLTNNNAFVSRSSFALFAEPINNQKDIVQIDFPPVIKVNGDMSPVYVIKSRTYKEGMVTAEYEAVEILTTRGVTPYAASFEATQKASTVMSNLLSDKAIKRSPGLDFMDDAVLMDDALLEQSYMQDLGGREATTQPTVQGAPKGEEVKPGIYVNQGALTKDEQLELFNMLKPYLEEQAAKTNKGTNASKMIGLGLRWDYKSNNPSKTAVNIPDVINPENKNKYGYYTTSINGQLLGQITPRFRQLMQKATGVDMTHYDGAIINLYEDTSFISSHNDVDESRSAINYPVIGINIGGTGNFSIESRDGSPKQLNLKAGTGYVFGVDGINREVWHRTFPTTQDSFLPSLTTKLDGKTYEPGSYRITITMRRIMPLEPGIPNKPAITTQPAVQTKVEAKPTEENLVTLRDGKQYKMADINAHMLMNMRLYTPEEIGQLLKELCK